MDGAEPFYKGDERSIRVAVTGKRKRLVGDIYKSVGSLELGFNSPILHQPEKENSSVNPEVLAKYLLGKI